MASFVDTHADKIQGTLSCFDRMLFRGYLPLESGYAMYEFLRARGVHKTQLKSFLTSQADRLKRHAQELASQAGRPYEYVTQPMRKQDWARERAEKDGITEGLVGVVSVLEPCRTFSLVWDQGQAYIRFS